MEKLYQYVESAIINFKLNYCCWIAPVRIGVIVIGYFNLIAALVSLVGTANESFSPTIMKVQEIILEDNASKPIPILAYTTELGFSVLLLCGMYRNDIVLLRVYTYYTTATVITSILVYSMVIAVIDILLTITVIFNTLFQVYMLLLLRSAIVEIRESAKQNGALEVVYNTDDEKLTVVTTKPEPEIEATVETDKTSENTEKQEPSPAKKIEPALNERTSPDETSTEHTKEHTKLETVEEDPKEG